MSPGTAGVPPAVPPPLRAGQQNRERIDLLRVVVHESLEGLEVVDGLELLAGRTLDQPLRRDVVTDAFSDNELPGRPRVML